MMIEEQEDCPDCDGTGCSQCANCGDGHNECACEDHECTDCDSCDGTGKERKDQDEVYDE